MCFIMELERAFMDKRNTERKKERERASFVEEGQVLWFLLFCGSLPLLCCLLLYIPLSAVGGGCIKEAHRGGSLHRIGKVLCSHGGFLLTLRE